MRTIITTLLLTLIFTSCDRRGNTDSEIEALRREVESLKAVKPALASEIVTPSRPETTKRALPADLSSFLDTYIDNVFSPLDTQTPPTLPRDLQVLEEQFRDGFTKASASDRNCYQIAIAVCGALAAGMDERGKQLARLADSRSKPHNPGLGRSMSNNPRIARLQIEAAQASAARTDKFFETQIVLSWTSSSKQLRQKVDSLYARLRVAERNRIVAPTTETLSIK